jgi:hypothetical protein
VRLALETIEGRCDDLFYFPALEDPARLVPVFPDFIRRAVLAAEPAPAGYVAMQRALDLVEFGFTAPEADRAAITASIGANVAALCARLGCAAPRLAFGPEPALEAGRKLKRVARAFAVEGEVGHG